MGQAILANTQPRRIVPDNENIQKSDFELFMDHWFPASANLRQQKQTQYGVPAVTVLPQGPVDEERRSQTSQSQGEKFTDIPDGHLVGTTAAATCIGVIVVSPPDVNGNRTIWVFHFDSGDDPEATLAAAGPFPQGSHVVFFGGQDHPDSTNTLDSVLDYFEGLPAGRVVIDGIYNSIGLWVNNAGNYYVNPNERH